MLTSAGDNVCFSAKCYCVWLLEGNSKLVISAAVLCSTLQLWLYLGERFS